MTAAEVLRLNGDLHDSGMMAIVRRFHAVSVSRGLPYCVIGGLAVVRNGYPRTTADVDILTYKREWSRLLPLEEGGIASKGLDACVDAETGETIDILFADEDWEMVLPMPDPRTVGEFDEELGACFIGLHDLVQLKMAVHLSKLRESGAGAAARDFGDVFELISRNLGLFSEDRIQTYSPAVRQECREAYASAVREATRVKRARRDITP
jgi:hypothetical protein